MTDYTNLLERLAVSAGDQECLYADAEAAIEALQVRLAEAEDTNKALRVRLGSELERAKERLADLECELYSYADVPRERLEESRRMDELKLRVTQLEADLAAERASREKHEPVAWEGAEQWEPLAMFLCADENGPDSCHELIWEGHPPEPWGERWQKYEREAKRMIDLVGQYAAPPVAAPVRLTDEQAEKVDEAIREALGDAYDCLRVWNAWSYGTMGSDDFSLVAEDSDRVADIRNAVAAALGFKVEGEQ